MFEGRIPLRQLMVLAIVVSAALFALLVAAPNSQKQLIPHSVGTQSVGSRSVSASQLPSFPFSETSSQLAPRPLFPYSIIPGGVESPHELKNAIALDPIVATHYEGFDLANARIIRLDQDRAVYVSYRLGEHVFWTKRSLKLLRGETLITDGRHEARTRCGNHISEAPATPIAPEEPKAEALEKPLGPDPVIASSEPFDLPLTLSPTTSIQPTEHDGKYFIPPSFRYYGDQARPRLFPSPLCRPRPLQHRNQERCFSSL